LYHSARLGLLGALVDVADERHGLRRALLAHDRVRHLAHAARDGRGRGVGRLVGAAQHDVRVRRGVLAGAREGVRAAVVVRHLRLP
jgi:hypothetical protein